MVKPATFSSFDNVSCALNREEVKYFVGSEVEKTRFYGAKTLFVVLKKSDSKLDLQEIKDIAEREHVKHIFVGANQSLEHFDANFKHNITAIESLIASGYYITVDGKDHEVTPILERFSSKDKRICGIISIDVPEPMGKNTYIKIDDPTGIEGKSNPGVWVFPCGEQMKDGNLTEWNKYEGDKNVE